MAVVTVVAPAGTKVTVPAEQAERYLAAGWKRLGEKPTVRKPRSSK